ncbi:glutamate racemase [Aquisalimonas asiatica]|uniref:Glutamate racemase n=1 Tax=Aquisalimonas asiatica TaxID=406100 RepID=A0A1H8U1F1_9GAMM|nr:glutamate racemase [Aquisalimonas asiatica]SEO96478.1 glutamate racemase [Aquisalimonas asiatica]
MTTAHANRATAPVGVFDSGLGGLSVLREIRALLPGEDLLYVADAAHVPYGNRTPDAIRARAQAVSGFLLEQGAKAVVVACNTATAVAVTALRERWRVPIIGMEPAIKPAAGLTRNGTVGVLATEGTLASARFAALLEQYAGDLHVVTQPCPGLVAAVESGELHGDRARALLARYLQPLQAAGADVIILGCTHYPFLTPAIRQRVGADVAIVDTGAAVAREVRRRLQLHGLLAPAERCGSSRFWSTGDLAAGEPVLARLWGEAAPLRPLQSAREGGLSA